MRGSGYSYRLGAEPPYEFDQIDDGPRMRAVPDFLVPVGRADGEFDLPPVDFGHLCLAGDLPTRRCRHEMTDVYRRSDSALAGIEIGTDRVEGGVLHNHDHDRRGEHRRQHRVLESIGEVLGLNEKAEGAFGSNRDLLHGVESYRQKSALNEVAGPFDILEHSQVRDDQHFVETQLLDPLQTLAGFVR